MMNIAAVQERGWIGKFAEGTEAGVWRWSLLGPAPQVKEEADGAGTTFSVDESVIENRGEYTISVQRLDVNGAPLGDSQSSPPFVIAVEVQPQIDIEIAGVVTVTITKG
jgi:hypothetical protein